MPLAAIQDAAAFPSLLYAYRMPGFDETLPPELMVERLLGFRFPFSRDSLGEAFIDDVRHALLDLPVFLLQALTYYQFKIQLDTAHDIGAIMDTSKRTLYLHRFFMMDGESFDLRDNPVFPYGIRETLLHELGHFLDDMLTLNQKLSSTPLFMQAIRKDLAEIPTDMVLNHQERAHLCYEAGGYLKLDEDAKQRVDVTLFCLQVEETFSEAFLHLASSGRSRPIIPQYFPHAIQAVAYLIGYHLRRWQPSRS